VHQSQYKDTWIAALATSDLAASSRPSDGACIIHHRVDELLVKQHTISDGQATSPVQEAAKHVQSLSCFSS
jgi:hypothetical protein